MTAPAAPVSTLRNLGPVMSAWLSRAGIATLGDLRRADADAAYAAMLAQGLRPHFIGFVALAMALEDRDWRDCRGDEKARLRARFDAIAAKQRAIGAPSIDAALAAIGVVEPGCL